MVCSLTITDLIWGATVAPVQAGFRLKHFMNSQVCEVYSELEEIPKNVPASMYFLGTFGNLGIISIDRYLAAKAYDQYELLVTRCRALIACALVWLMSTTIGILRQGEDIPEKLFLVLVAGFVILTAAVTIIAQIMAVRCLHLHNNALAEMMEEGNQVNSVNTANAAIERALTKTTTYVVGVLALVFIPLVAFMVATFITKMPLVKLANPIVFPLVALYSGINPVLYYRGNQKVKEGISKLFKCQ